jgi:hypothetical protein
VQSKKEIYFMKTSKFYSGAVFLIVALALAGCSSLGGDKNKPSTLLDSAVDAYIYGYPLVTMEYTRRVMTNVPKSMGKLAPMGQFAHLRNFPLPTDKEVTAPNADTLYSLAWLDLSQGPYVFNIPASAKRYYLMPMLSGWTDVFQSPGSRTTGEGAQTYLITGPGWSGQVPAGMTEYKSPTSLLWILGRTYSTGTAEDFKKVHAFQNNLKLFPLSALGKKYSPAKGKVDSSIDMKTPPREQVNTLSGQMYFSLLAQLLKANPPAQADTDMVETLNRLGITPGQDFNFDSASSEIQNAMNEATKVGLDKIIAQRAKAGEIVNGWVYSNKTGDYGTDYLQRAFITYFGLGANLVQDAIYPSADIDSTGQPLNGSYKYVLRFKTTPPVNGFWSLTMYDEQYFFVPNTLKRYNLNMRNNMKYNADGSLDIYVQKDSPGAAKEANWLPAPQGAFNLMLRTYWPKEEMIDGKWRAPAIEKVN